MVPHFFITKVDEVKREVGGVLTDEHVDKDGESLDYNSSKPYFQKWSNDAFEETKRTLGPEKASFGNLREQHSARAVGKFTSINFDDSAKSIYGVAKVFDDDVWQKVAEGVYRGFSIKGKSVGLPKYVGNVKKYTVDPIEVSLVDNQCNPRTYFDFVRAADGATVQKSFKSQDEPGDEEECAKLLIAASADTIKALIAKRDVSTDERKRLAKEGKALPDGSFPIANEGDLKNAIQAYGRASDPEAAKKHIIARAKELGRTDLLPDKWAVSKEKKMNTKFADAVKAAAAQFAETIAKLADEPDYGPSDKRKDGPVGEMPMAVDTAVKAAMAPVNESIAKMAAENAELTKTVATLAKSMKDKEEAECKAKDEAEKKAKEAKAAEDEKEKAKLLGDIAKVTGNRADIVKTGQTAEEIAKAAKAREAENLELMRRGTHDASALVEVMKRTTKTIPIEKVALAG